METVLGSVVLLSDLMHINYGSNGISELSLREKESFQELQTGLQMVAAVLNKEVSSLRIRMQELEEKEIAREKKYGLKLQKLEEDKVARDKELASLRVEANMWKAQHMLALESYLTEGIRGERKESS